MKPTMKFALSLLIGVSVFTLSACNNQETKTPEKTTALSETKAEVTAEKAADLIEKKEENVSTDSKENNVEAALNKPQNETTKVEEVKTTTQPTVVEKKTTEVVEQSAQAT